MSIDDDDEATRILPSHAPKPGSPARRTEMAPERTEFAPPAGAFDPDGDATVIRPRPPPPAPQRVPSSEGGNMLPVGFYLGEFEIVKVLGEGGFGIVYLADDHSLGRRVALKEYMPSSLAQRVGGTQVSVKSERHRETFEAGLKSFVNEARLLAQFDHPSLVKVYRFWEANGTAYMVMPFYEGITLKDELKAMGAPPDEEWLRELLEPLTEALAVIHTEQCFHRDIAPDNVILLKGSQRPLLLDFGAARRVIGDMTQALTAILKPGYAPVEQYADMPGLKQGPWTDVYALAAVVHWMIMRKTPPPSVGRLFDDPYVPLAQSAAGRYSDAFLRAIDHALAVMPEKRTASIEAMRVELFGGALPAGAPIAVAAAAGTATQEVPRSQPHPRTQTQRHEPARQDVPATEQRTRAEAAPAAPAPVPGNRVLLVAGGAGRVVVAALAAFALWPQATPPGTTTTATPTVAPAAVTAAPAASVVAPSAPAPTPVVATPRVDTPAVVAPAASATPAPATTTATTLPARDAASSAEVPHPTAAADARPAAARRPPPPRVETPPAPAQARPVEPKAADNSAECARIFQLISLGQADQAVMDRFRTLRCR